MNYLGVQPLNSLRCNGGCSRHLQLKGENQAVPVAPADPNVGCYHVARNGDGQGI